MNPFDEQLRAAMEGYQPEVTPNFSAFEKSLRRSDALGSKDLSRRYQWARRVAVGSTAVALGLLGWLMTREEVELPTQEALQVVGGGQGAQGGDWNKFDDLSGDGLRPVALSNAASDGAARTSNSVLISAPKQGASEASTGEAVLNETSHGVKSAPLAAATTVAAEPNASTAAPSSAALLGFESSVQEACEGTEVSFKLDGDWTEGSFLWNFGDGAFSSESEPSHVFDRPGTYDITISVRSHNDGQIRTRTVENMIVVRPRPDARLTWELPKSIDGKSVPVSLMNQTERSSSSTWLVGEERLSQGTAEFKVPGEYPIHLIASNAYGCQDHETATLKLGDRLGAGAPSSFSPDGDGRYDTFLPRITMETNEAWEFAVYDAKGELVFESNNAQRPWNGADFGGEVHHGQRFTWVLHLTDSHGLPTMYSDVVRVE